MKPRFILFYKNDETIDNVLNKSHFVHYKPTKVKRSKDEARIEFDYFVLICKRVNRISDNLRGTRCWYLLIEDVLYDELSEVEINEILLPMLSPVFLGTIKRVSNRFTIK